MTTRDDEGFGLACQTCHERFPMKAPMEAVKLHFEVEHDTDDIRLDLVVVCSCGANMTLTRREPRRGGGEMHHFDCPSCKRSRAIRQGPGGGA